MTAVSAKLAGTLLAGCSTTTIETTDPPALHNGSFSARPALLTDADIHTLTATQQRDILEYFESPAYTNVPAHQRVCDCLDRIADSFS